MRFWGLLIILGAALSLISCHSAKKRILVIHSYASDYPAYPEYNHLIARDFRQAGMKVELSFFYLDCERYNAKGEIDRLNRLLDSIAGWQPELVLLNDDQATYSALKTYHPLLRKIPLVFTGVNYPNWELLNEYTNVTGFQDQIDYRTNCELVASFTGKKFIHTVLDYTYLDKKVREDIEQQLKDGNIISNLDFHLNKQEVEEVTSKGNIVVSAYSIRNPSKNWRENSDSTITGGSFLWNFSKYNASPYLQTKFDFTTETIGGFSTTKRFTSINEMFGCGYNFLGGYMTPLIVQVDDLVKTAVRILKGEAPAAIPIAISHKEYLMDWEVMQKEGIKIADVPKGFQIINIPFKAQYPIVWVFLIWGSTAGLSVIFILLIFLYIREARKKRQMGRALKDERKFLALAIKGSKTYAWKIEKSVLVFERAFQEAQHLVSTRLTPEEFSCFIHPEYRHYCNFLFQEVCENDENRIELRCDFNGKGYRWWELRYSIIEDAFDGKNIAGLLLDIEEYKAREQELIEARELAEQAELKQSFLANMSHEIRTPLNAIVGFSNILASAEHPLDKEEQKQFVDLINSNSELLLKLINDILEISRIESGYMSFEFAYYPLQPLLDEVYQTHKMLVPEQLQFIEETDQIPVQLYIDKNRMTQVLTNFISNACKFTKEGYIKLGYHYLADRKQVEIFVEDTGIGIPKIEQKMIFSRFYKQNEFIQGTGLGLSICRVIIEKLHGEIGLWSEPGKGSRFSIFMDCEMIKAEVRADE